jgi:hypothetical protein
MVGVLVCGVVVYNAATEAEPDEMVKAESPIKVSEPEPGDLFTYNEQPVEIEYIGADGHTITFAHNSSAVDPTYNQVIDFLKSDTTDQTSYDLNSFVCADYAEQVQHHAEAAGYRCGWVFLDLTEFPHACNVFNTTDRGLIFIDSTGFDSVVEVKEGSEYRPIPLSKLLGYNSGVSADPMGIVKSYKIEW